MNCAHRSVQPFQRQRLIQVHQSKIAEACNNWIELPTALLSSFHFIKDFRKTQKSRKLLSLKRLKLRFYCFGGFEPLKWRTGKEKKTVQYIEGLSWKEWCHLIGVFDESDIVVGTLTATLIHLLLKNHVHRFWISNLNHLFQGNPTIFHGNWNMFTWNKNRLFIFLLHNFVILLVFCFFFNQSHSCSMFLPYLPVPSSTPHRNKTPSKLLQPRFSESCARNGSKMDVKLDINKCTKKCLRTY